MPGTYMVTGHRPGRLWGHEMSDARYGRVRDALRELLGACGAEALVSGMALGFDTLAAECAVGMGLPLVAAVPFEGQDSGWPGQARRRYCELLSAAERVVVVSEGGYAAWKMQARNRWMVDNSEAVVALWDGGDGGTGDCVRYAARRGRPVYALDPAEVRPDAPAAFSPWLDGSGGQLSFDLGIS